MRTDMVPWIRAATFAALALGAFPIYAAAGDARSEARRQAVDRPLKECTRINGRMGYYASPWCTPAEQVRWDRWEAQRLRAR
jgi:hypothetical protein